MHRMPLGPPRTLALGSMALDSTWPGLEESPEGARSQARPAQRSLEAPSPAREHRRHLFHPEKGWFRAMERELSLFLSRAVYPRVPAISRPYDRQLSRDLTLSEAELALPGLAREFDGCRLLLISDIHAGPFVSPQVLRATFERLMAVEPDLILLAGDLITSQTSEFARQRGAFRSLEAALGVFCVLGNHDHYCPDVDRLRRLIERAGLRLLHNESVTLRRGSGQLSLAGVDDLLNGRPALRPALAATRPPVILLSHNPDLLFEAARAGVALVLAGHTHAGQVRIPGLPVLVRQSVYRLDEGRYRYGRTELVVSRGLGAVGLPWRVACPPEAVLLTLRAAS